MALLHMEDFYNLDRNQAGALYAVGGDPQMGASRFPGTGKSFGMRFLGSSATRSIPARPEISSASPLRPTGWRTFSW